MCIWGFINMAKPSGTWRAACASMHELHADPFTDTRTHTHRHAHAEHDVKHGHVPAQAWSRVDSSSGNRTAAQATCCKTKQAHMDSCSANMHHPSSWSISIAAVDHPQRLAAGVHHLPTSNSHGLSVSSINTSNPSSSKEWRSLIITGATAFSACTTSAWCSGKHAVEGWGQIRCARPAKMAAGRSCKQGTCGCVRTWTPDAV